MGGGATMKLSKDLENALETACKEVEGWPAWKRSIDLKNPPKESSRNSEGNDQETPRTRAAQA